MEPTPNTRGKVKQTKERHLPKKLDGIPRHHFHSFRQNSEGTQAEASAMDSSKNTHIDTTPYSQNESEDACPQQSQAYESDDVPGIEGGPFYFQQHYPQPSNVNYAFPCVHETQEGNTVTDSDAVVADMILEAHNMGPQVCQWQSDGHDQWPYQSGSTPLPSGSHQDPWANSPQLEDESGTRDLY